MRRATLVAALVVLGLGGFYLSRGRDTLQLVSQPITRGDVIDAVGATGTLEAVTTVQVGTQVSGTVQHLYADYNAPVTRGQVIARLDPELFRTQVEQARANLMRAEADLARSRLVETEARRKRDQTARLIGAGIVAQSDLDTAETTLQTAITQVQSADAQVRQARASLNQSEVSLAKTVITAPIDGTVIARNVDVGQTVAASLQAPTLFVIAADLTKMRVNASINEADIGRVLPGQTVRFHVDAFPADEFVGTLSLVRLSPITQQNVVTYAAVIDVANPRLKLKPGMTATVSVEIAARRRVLRIPNAALRFRPTDEMLAAFGASLSARAPLQADDADEGQSTGRVWLQSETGLREVVVLLGVSDGTSTEVLSRDLVEGTRVITGTAAGTSRSSGAAGSSTMTNPLMGPQRPPGQRGGGR
ncbi:MAG TPA: efflux RND transporter periplasmic adaptor subunit [Vicinamibacterales bacterium]|nr:efflux RND transporter periplasmic adaptor subunit [Vicinamibacterales bacterium]